MRVERISIKKPHTLICNKTQGLFSLPPLGTLHNLMISLSGRDGEAEAQDYIVSVQMVDLEQIHEHSLKNLLELHFFCRVGYFAVSHRMVSEALILTECKTQVKVQLI